MHITVRNLIQPWGWFGASLPPWRGRITFHLTPSGDLIRPQVRGVAPTRRRIKRARRALLARIRTCPLHVSQWVPSTGSNDYVVGVGWPAEYRA